MKQRPVNSTLAALLKTLDSNRAALEESNARYRTHNETLARSLRAQGIPLSQPPPPFKGYR
jgi:hypothetical protein